MTTAPCPFCGGDDVSFADQPSDDLEGVWEVECNECIAHFTFAVPKGKTVYDVWNTRKVKKIDPWDTELSVIDCRDCKFLTDRETRGCIISGFARADPRYGCVHWRGKE